MRRLIALFAAVLLCARGSAVEERENEPSNHERREALKAILGDAPPALLSTGPLKGVLVSAQTQKAAVRNKAGIDQVGSADFLIGKLSGSP